MLLKFSALCVSKDEGSSESIYRRQSMKPLVEDVKDNFKQASAPDHLNMIPEDLEELICEQDGKSQLHKRMFIWIHFQDQGCHCQPSDKYPVLNLK